MSEPVLCYISGNWAYFTTRELDQQWGDDWNDAPYEHNAGDPYDWRGGGEPKWQIIRVAFLTNLETPASLAPGANSAYSVEMINKRIVPWLMPDPFSVHSGNIESIWAGTTLSEFKRRIIEYGGEVYERVQP